MFGSPFLTWRGIPIIPSDKVPVVEGKSKVLLIRSGEKRQGVVGLFQPGLAGEQSPGLSVRFMGINRNAISSYLISLYCSLAVLTEDALAVLEDVEVDKYHSKRDCRTKQRSVVGQVSFLSSCRGRAKFHLHQQRIWVLPRAVLFRPSACRVLGQSRQLLGSLWAA
jgi:hypothetical protein